MTFVRTVLGDIAPEELGVTYAHEHLVIDGGRPVLLEPEFDLARRRGDGDRGGRGGRVRAALRGRCHAVRRRPECRDARRASRGGPGSTSSPRPGSTTTATTARPTGATGCRSRSWPTCSSPTSPTASMPTTTPGRSCAGRRSVPGSSRSPAPRAGCRRATGACSRRRPQTHRRTGAPILTHCEHGTGALEQVRFLGDHGVSPESHRPEPRRQGRRPRLSPGAARDRCVRRVRQLVPLGGRRAQRHRAAASAGWPRTGSTTGSSLGMDAARRRYYRVHGGAPGLAWLLDGFTPAARGCRRGRRRSAIDCS